MAAVIGELLIGENFVQRFLNIKAPELYAYQQQQAMLMSTGEFVLPYTTNYAGLEHVLSSDITFLQFLRALLDPWHFPQREMRRRIFEGVILCGPDMMWSSMYLSVGTERKLTGSCCTSGDEGGRAFVNELGSRGSCAGEESAA